MPSSPEVIVVGGGVVGCSIGYHLAKAGVRVALLERRRFGSGASDAATGQFTFQPGHDDYARFCRESLALFQVLAGELKEAGGVDIELVKSGALHLAFSEEEALDIQDNLKEYNNSGSAARWLDQREAHELEPGLSKAVIGASFVPETCRVHNQRISEAFARAGMLLGGDFRQGVEVIGLSSSGQRITGVRLHGQELHADHVVIAAGAWSGIMAGWVDGLDSAKGSMPVRPVRGQNINVQPFSGGIRFPINYDWGVLVPRNDGSIIAGSTVADTGFDSRVTVEGIQAITNMATKMVPSFGDATLNWTIAGLRPGSPDDMPLLGPVPGVQGLSIASGHYKRGVLLSSGTGKLMAEYLTSGKEPELLRAFSPARFGK